MMKHDDAANDDDDNGGGHDDDDDDDDIVSMLWWWLYIFLGMDETFGSTCHGAGRAQSRNKSRRNLSYQEVFWPHGYLLLLVVL